MKARVSSLIAIAVLGSTSISPVSAEDTAALLKRGAYLVNGPVACANCHTPRDKDFSLLPGMEFSGDTTACPTTT